MTNTSVLLDDLLFGEGPRWHDGRLWFSDFFRKQVRAVTMAREVELIAEVPEQPSGLGFLPDGRLLIASMGNRSVLRRRHDGSLVRHADLSGVTAGAVNDLLADSRGRAYVGNFGGPDPATPGVFLPTGIALVHQDGAVEIVADDMVFPNGMAMANGGHVLLVAETYGSRITAFTVDQSSGRLGERRIWANLPGVHPDGIALDAKGNLWVADPPKRQCLLVGEGGSVLGSVATRYPCIAPCLGGPTGHTLFLCTSAWPDATVRCLDTDPVGLIETIDVAVPAMGC